MTVQSSNRPQRDRGISAADERVLRVVLRYRQVSAEQVRRVLYGRGSLKYAYARLKGLVDGGYLLHHQPPGGPGVYWLAGKGRRYLELLGLDVPERYRPAEVHEHASIFYRHALAVADVLVAADLLAQRHPAVDVEAMLHDADLQRRPVTVTLGDGQRRRVVPDGWLDLIVQEAEDRFHVPLVLELDRGTHERRRFQAKIEALLAFADGPYQAAYGRQSLTIIVVATPGEMRRAELVAWTEAVLRAQHAEPEADLFRFTGVDPATVQAADWFLMPWWCVPFSPTPIPLLTLDPLLAEHPGDAARPYDVVNFRVASPPVRSVPSHYMSAEAMSDFLTAIGDDEPVMRRQEPYSPAGD
jgi:hypothetical protein